MGRVPSRGRAIVAQRAEWETALDDNPRLIASYDQPELRLVRDWGAEGWVDGERELLPGVSVIPTGGHSAGHQAILVRAPGAAPLAFFGDLMMRPWAANPRWVTSFDDFPLDVRRGQGDVVRAGRRRGLDDRPLARVEAAGRPAASRSATASATSRPRPSRCQSGPDAAGWAFGRTVPSIFAGARADCNVRAVARDAAYARHARPWAPCGTPTRPPRGSSSIPSTPTRDRRSADAAMTAPPPMSFGRSRTMASSRMSAMAGSRVSRRSSPARTAASAVPSRSPSRARGRMSSSPISPRAPTLVRRAASWRPRVGRRSRSPATCRTRRIADGWSTRRSRRSGRSMSS